MTAPREIAPGEQGSINVAYLIPETDPRYGTLRDVLGIRIDGRTGYRRTKRPESADNRKYY